MDDDFFVIPAPKRVVCFPPAPEVAPSVIFSFFALVFLAKDSECPYQLVAGSNRRSDIRLGAPFDSRSSTLSKKLVLFIASRGLPPLDPLANGLEAGTFDFLDANGFLAAPEVPNQLSRVKSFPMIHTD